jgi:hypothetical protein
MSALEMVDRDERTVAVANAGYRLAYMVLTYALLVDVMVRGLVLREAAWDLLALVVAGGVICTVHQERKDAMPSGWVRTMMVIAAVAAVIAAIVAAVMSRL